MDIRPRWDAATLAHWRSAPAGPPPITDDESDLLHAIALARQTKDYLPLNRWGGVLEAAKAAARIEARQQPDIPPTASIDRYSTHVAARLASDTLAL